MKSREHRHGVRAAEHAEQHKAYARHVLGGDGDEEDENEMK